MHNTGLGQDRVNNITSIYTSHMEYYFIYQNYSHRECVLIIMPLCRRNIHAPHQSHIFLPGILIWLCVRWLIMCKEYGEIMQRRTFNKVIRS